MKKNRNRIAAKMTNQKVIWLPSLFILISHLIFLLALLVDAFLKPNNSAIQKLCDGLTTETGLTIFGIAVSVWIGLNVYNAVRKDDIEKLYNIVEKGTENLQQQIQFIQTQNYQMFLNALIQSYGSVVGRYFYEHFASISKIGFYDGSFIELLPILIKTELSLNTLIEYNRSCGNLNDRTDVIVEEVLQDLGVIVNNGKVKYSNSKLSNDLVSYYLDVRYADFLFYSRKMEDINLAIKQYKKLVNSIINRKYDQVDMNLLVYFYNCLGYLYFRSNKYERSMDYFMHFSEGKYQELMIPTYYRNWGVCYERLEDFKKAIDKYNTAISIIDREPKEYKVYVTYVSAMLKKFDEKYYKKKIWPGEKEGPEIRKCRAYIEIAKNKNPSFADTYIKSILLYAYEYVLQARNGASAFDLRVIEERVEEEYTMKTVLRNNERFENARTRFNDAKTSVGTN